MRLIACILVLCTLLSACKKENDENPPQIPAGVYAGTFSRTGMETVQVKIEFEANTYEGQSDTDKYPAICHGSYSLSNDRVIFTDVCTWTADFDWSLILNGTYTISFQDDGWVRIWRISGSVTDEYLLRKLER
ncbi:MAG: hypothetical protein ABW019_09835 [Chitinophagaceae bacterium]